MGKIKNLSLLKTTTDMSAMLTKGREKLIAKTKLFFQFLDLTILNSYINVTMHRKITYRKLCGFGSKFIANEYKAASFSIHPKRKTKPTSQPNGIALKPDTWSISQLQDCTYGFMCA